MGLVKKTAKGALAVGTLGGSLAAEKAVKSLVINDKIKLQDDLTAEEAAAGIIFRGLSHDPGRNANVTLYADRIERVKERSRASFSKAAQDTEMTPIKSVSSVEAKKEGFYTKVTVYAVGNNIEFLPSRRSEALQRCDPATDTRRFVCGRQLGGSACANPCGYPGAVEKAC